MASSSPTLYTLQHGLTRDTQFHGCFQHGQILRRGLWRDAVPQFFGDADLPWRAGSDLFTGDEAFSQPAMDSPDFRLLTPNP